MKMWPILDIACLDMNVLMVSCRARSCLDGYSHRLDVDIVGGVLINTSLFCMRSVTKRSARMDQFSAKDLVFRLNESLRWSCLGAEVPCLP